MVTLTVEKTGSVPAIAPRMAPVFEFALRLVGAALQVFATIAVVKALAPDTAGVYFRGFVIAYGLAALLRGKYELFITHYLIAERQPDFGVSVPALLRTLGRRVAIRAAIASAGLLVVTADLDIMAPHLQPYLQTYLPFVLAVPFASLALFMADALRAVNRTVSSIAVSIYCMNAAILVAALLAPPELALAILSWAFLAGSILATIAGFFAIRSIFGTSVATYKLKPKSVAWREIYAAAACNGITGMALAGLLWGPLCVLAVFGQAVHMAEFAVAGRTAQIVDLMIPALIFIPHSIHLRPRLRLAMRSAKGHLVVDVLISVATGSAFVLVVAAITPWLVTQYGAPYAELPGLFALLLAMQWVNAAGRPAIRRLTADWQAVRSRNVLVGSTTAAILISLLGVGKHGALAAAGGMLVGALLLNGQALWWAFHYWGTTPTSASRE